MRKIGKVGKVSDNNPIEEKVYVVDTKATIGRAVSRSAAGIKNGAVDASKVIGVVKESNLLPLGVEDYTSGTAAVVKTGYMYVEMAGANNATGKVFMAADGSFSTVKDTTYIIELTNITIENFYEGGIAEVRIQA